MLIVGGTVVNKTAKETASALQLNFAGLKPEGFLIKSGRVRNRAIVVIAGNDGLSTLYGVYEFIERLGDTFRLTGDRKSTRLNSSHGYISYAVFCLKKKNTLIHIITLIMTYLVI